MKRIWLAGILLSFAISLSAQSGIYITADDYEAGTLSYAQKDGEKHAIRADIPFNKYVVKVVNGDESHKLFKWDVYGYKNKKNEYFRFYNEKKYRIIDPSHFHLYAREENIINGKEKTRETRYFFSRNAESPVLPLTMNNLKHTFRDREFHDLLNLYFRSDKELLRYDSYNKEYLLKRIAKISGNTFHAKAF